MIILDPDGLFGGDRIRACSNEAQLHFHRLLLISNGYGRLELNYLKIIGAAYSTFRPPPSEPEIFTWIQQYVDHHLLFPYRSGAELWGQWDITPRLLPRYRTAKDRRSPMPPESQLAEWKEGYLSEKASFPKFSENFQKLSAKFPLAVADAVADAVVDTHKTIVCVSKPKVSDLNGQTSQRWEEFWGKYPRKVNKDAAAHNFVSYVTLEAESKVFACLSRYLASAEVARGAIMNPDKWLLQQHRDNWQAEWPATESKGQDVHYGDLSAWKKDL